MQQSIKIFIFFALLLFASRAEAQMKEEVDPDNYRAGYTSSDITTTASTQMIAAQGTGFRIYLRTCMITNGSTSTDTRVDILDGSNPVGGGYTFHNGGGFVVRFDPPLRGSTNTALNVQAGTSGAAVRANCSGFVAAR